MKTRAFPIYNQLNLRLMLRKNAFSAFRLPFQASSLHWSRQYSPFSTFSPNIKTDFFMENGKRKRFFFEKTATLNNVESILKKEDKSFQSIVFKLDNAPIEDKGLLFTDVFLKKNLKVEINRHVVPVHVDLAGPAAYINDTPYDEELAKNEVPIHDALLLTNFTKILKQNLENRCPGKQSYDPNEIREAVADTIRNFKAKNDEKLSRLQHVVEDLQVEQMKDKKQYDLLIEKVQGKANRVLKYLIFATLVQWGVLFYLTYYEVGWDVVEPISYLISLGLETIGIYFYLRYSKSLSQRTIADMMFRKKKMATLKKISLNPELELTYLSNKINYFVQRGAYLKA